MKLDLLSLIKSGLKKVVSQTSKAPHGPTFEGALSLAKRGGPPSVVASESSMKDSPPAQKPAVSFAPRYSSPHIETHDKLKSTDEANKRHDPNGTPKPVEGKGKSKNPSVEVMPLVAGVSTTVVPTQAAKPTIAAAEKVTVEKVAKPTQTEAVGNSPAVAPTTVAVLSQVERRIERTVEQPKAGNQTRSRTAVPIPNVENSISGVERRPDKEQAPIRLNPRVIANEESRPNVEQVTATAHKLNHVSEESAQAQASEEVTTVSSKSNGPSIDKVKQTSNQNQKTEQNLTAPIVDSRAAKSSQLKQHEGAATREPRVVQRLMQKELVTEAMPKQQPRAKSDFANNKQEMAPVVDRESVPQKPVVGQIVHENRLPNQVEQPRFATAQSGRSEVVARVWEGPKEHVPQQVVTRVAANPLSLDTKAPETVVQVANNSNSKTKRPTDFARVPANNREVPDQKNLTTPEVKSNATVKAQSAESPKKSELTRARVFVEREELQKPAVLAETSPVVPNNSHSVKHDAAPLVSHEFIGKSFTKEQAMPQKTLDKSPAQLGDAKPVASERGAKSVVKEVVTGSVSMPAAESMKNGKAVEKAIPVVHPRAQVNEVPIKLTTSQVVASAKHSDYGIKGDTTKSATPIVPKTVPVLHSRLQTEETVSPQPKRVVAEPMKPTMREIISELRTDNPTSQVVKEVHSESFVSTQNFATKFDAQIPQMKDATIFVAPNEMKQHEAPTAKELPVVERKANEQYTQTAPEKAPETVLKREPVVTHSQSGKAMPQLDALVRAVPQVIPFTPIAEPRTGSVVTNSFDGSRTGQAKYERISNEQGERVSERSENSVSGKGSELKSIESLNTTKQEANSQSGEREAGNSAARAAMEKSSVNQSTATTTAKSTAFASSAANESLRLALQQALEQSRRRLVEPDELRLTLRFGEMGTLDIDVLRESDKFSIRIAAEPAMAAMMEEQRLQLAGWLKEQGFPIQQLEIAERQGGQARREGLASENSTSERDSGERRNSGGGSSGGLGHGETSESGLPQPAYSGARVWTA